MLMTGFGARVSNETFKVPHATYKIYDWDQR